MTVAPRAVIPLARNQANAVILDIIVHSDGGWHLNIGDVNTGPSRGHMLSVPGAGSMLEAAMEVSVGTAGPHDLSAAGSVALYDGNGTATVPLRLTQLVTAGDLPGEYGIDLVVTAIAGF